MERRNTLTIFKLFSKFVIVSLLLFVPAGCKQVAKTATEDVVEVAAKSEAKHAVEQTAVRQQLVEATEIVISKETKEANSKLAKEFLKKSGRDTHWWDKIMKTLNKRFIQMSEKMTPELLQEIKRLVPDKKVLDKIVSDLEKNPELLSTLNRNPKLLKIWETLINTSHRMDSRLLEHLEIFRLRYVDEGMGDKALWETMTFVEKDGALICKSGKYPNTEMIYKNGTIRCKAGSAGDGGSALNEFLMVKRMPNCQYIIDEVFVFTTDAMGRTSSIKATLNKQTIAKINRYRNNAVQTQAVEVSGDAGGHGIAYALGGPSELINLTSMSSKLNNGEYQIIENTILRAIESGETVIMSITNIYKETSTRPIKYIYEYVINGKKTVKVLSNS